MANTRSAKKMVRKIARRTEVNKARRSRVRTFWNAALWLRSSDMGPGAVQLVAFKLRRVV